MEHTRPFVKGNCLIKISSASARIAAEGCLRRYRGRAQVEIINRRVAMGIFKFIGQILLGTPFVVFAYWYEQEETLFQAAPTAGRTIYRHAAFGLFFSIAFAILGMVFFPPITGTTVLLACIYIFVRSLDNIEQDKAPASRGK
jgi:hypothetical protein